MTAQGRHKEARRTQGESSSKSWSMVVMSRRARGGVVGVDTRREDGVFANDREVLLVAAMDHVLTHLTTRRCCLEAARVATSLVHRFDGT